MKKCSKCKLEYPFEFFDKQRAKKDGVASNCKNCTRAMTKRWREANKEKHRAMIDDWKRKNPEKVKTHDKKRYEKNASEVCARVRTWYAANSERSKANMKNWKLANPHKNAAHWAKRRARRIKATPAWANQEKIAEFYRAADFLGMVTGEWYHVDHIVPLKHPLVCGLHWEGNLQVLTAAENLKKHNTFVV